VVLTYNICGSSENYADPEGRGGSVLVAPDPRYSS